MKKKLLFVLMITGFIAQGCYSDVEEELYGLCNTGNVTYSSTVSGLLNAYGCISCHSGTAPDGGFALTDYAKVKAKVTDGKLLGAITHANGFSPMPKGSAKMNACDISKIKAWIDAGAQNN